MENKIVFGAISLLLSLFLVNVAEAQVSEYSQITEQFCDARNPCPTGLECFSFPGIGLRCAQPNPCSYFKCPKGTQCIVGESFPGQVMCICTGPECPAVSGAEKTVEYNLLTQTVVHVIKENETVSHNISLWKTTIGNRGLLETTVVSAEYSNELVVEDSKLFMITPIGKKQINILPEDAIAVSETPAIKLVKKVELKEESQKPIYSVQGTKQTRIFFIIPVSMKVETKIDAETGNLISVNKPWWSFFAW